MTEKKIIGRNALVDVADVQNVPAKIDTGADSSAIWASSIEVKPSGTLEFVLFDQQSSFYTGKIIKTDTYRVAAVKNSTGQRQIRYQTKLTLTMAGKKINANFNLSNRSKNKFPILIGRRTLNKKFLVDVSKFDIKTTVKKTEKLNQELKQDQYKFYKKYSEERSN